VIQKSGRKKLVESNLTRDAMEFKTNEKRIYGFAFFPYKVVRSQNM